MVEWVLLMMIASVVAMSFAPLYPDVFFPALVVAGISWSALYVAFLMSTKEDLSTRHFDKS